MNILAKYFFLVAGVLAAAIAVFNENIASGIVAAGAFIAFALMETAGPNSKK
ncbi:MAG: hypothetical protein JNK14_20865 [Chitinophagaceae bacterium]|nr:hypothetical protein [Chitinophagaceae bacterium]